MANLTDSAIKKALREAAGSGSRVTLRDGTGRGTGRLALMVRPLKDHVLAEWYAVHQQDGRRALRKLGTYPGMPLAEARDAFRDLPAPAQPSTVKVGTLGELVEEYLANLQARGGRSVATASKTLAQAVTALGADRAANSITSSEVSAFLRQVFERGARSHANTIRSWLHAVFNWALGAEHAYTSRQVRRWEITINPVAAVPRDQGATRAGERFLEEAELAGFWYWLESRPSRYRQALQLIAATGQRVQEITHLRGEQVDRQAWAISWATTKNGKPHSIPVPAIVRPILAALPETGLLFPGTDHPDRPVDSITVLKIAVGYQQRHGVTAFTSRDLRRTWKTLAARAGLSKDERDLIQNHLRSDISSKHYDRHSYAEERRAAMDKWNVWLTHLLETKKTP